MVALWMLACAGSIRVSGEVGGEPVVLRGGYFTEEVGAYDNGDDRLSIAFTGYRDACDTTVAANQALTGASDPAEAGAAWAATLPEDFWRLDLTVRVADLADSLDGATFAGASWGAEPDAGEVSGAVVHFRQPLDEAFFGGVKAPSEYLDDWSTDGGALTLEVSRGGDEIVGRFTADAADEIDGNNAGSVEVSFSVGSCDGAASFAPIPATPGTTTTPPPPTDTPPPSTTTRFDDVPLIAATCEGVAPDVVCYLSGAYTAPEQRLSADITWVLLGAVFIGDDVNESLLAIDPGTTIVGDSESGGFLVIRRGSQIFAMGTAEDPIVFTSEYAPEARHRADWGGLVINGRAPVNLCETAGAVCEAFGDGGSGLYGGDDPDDSSGELHYVRTEYAGQAVIPDDELPGFLFQGVGRGTVVDHIQAHLSGDDGVDLYGGTVDLKYVVVTGALDDALDWQLGWSGRAQFGILQGYVDVGNNGIEADSSEAEPDASPRSSPTLAHFTIVGDTANPSADNGVLLRRGTGGLFYSVAIQGWERCFNVADEVTAAQAAQGILGAVSSTIYGPSCSVAATPTTAMYQGWSSGSVFGAGVVDVPILTAPDDPVAPDFRPIGAAAAGGTSPSDPWFESATFKGAMGPDAADDWFTAGRTDGWVTTVPPNVP